MGYLYCTYSIYIECFVVLKSLLITQINLQKGGDLLLLLINSSCVVEVEEEWEIPSLSSFLFWPVVIPPPTYPSLMAEEKEVTFEEEAIPSSSSVMIV